MNGEMWYMNNDVKDPFFVVGENSFVFTLYCFHHKSNSGNQQSALSDMLYFSIHQNLL